MEPADQSSQLDAILGAAERALVIILEERVAELEAALAPFVAEASRRSWITNLSPESGLDEMNIGGSALTNGDLRRARAALTPRVPA